METNTQLSSRWYALAIVLIAGGLALLGINSWRAGLAAQSDIMVMFIVPLLFSGLLLGRSGVWLTLACYMPILLVGVWTDVKDGPADLGLGQALSALTQPLLASLIVALILDRLIAKVDRGNKLNHDLAAICARLEDEIHEHERSHMQLVHSQRVDALGRLASGIAHDFSNLLGVMSGYVYRTEGCIGDNEEGRKYLQGLKSVTRRGQQLTSQLLTLARSDEFSVQTFDVGDVVELVSPFIRQLFPQNVVVEVERETDKALVRLDRAGFEAVLLNMAKNASDALVDGGRFTLRITVLDEEACIHVEDTGQGMNSQTQARIFDPFFSTKPRGQGTGIGLAMAYRVITEAGGRIEVESMLGQGTCFSIHLPLAQTTA